MSMVKFQGEKVHGQLDMLVIWMALNGFVTHLNTPKRENNKLNL